MVSTDAVGFVVVVVVIVICCFLVSVVLVSVVLPVLVFVQFLLLLLCLMLLSLLLVSTTTTFSTGSLIEIGDRTFLYQRQLRLPKDGDTDSETPPPPPPPCKPARMDHYARRLQADIAELEQSLKCSEETCASIMQSVRM